MHGVPGTIRMHRRYGENGILLSLDGRNRRPRGFIRGRNLKHEKVMRRHYRRRARLIFNTGRAM